MPSRKRTREPPPPPDPPEDVAETEERGWDHTEGSAEEHTLRSESFLEEQHYEDAVVEAELALDKLPVLARAALTRGRALLYPALAKMDEGGERPPKELLHEAGRAFMLASFLDNECEEAEEEVEKLKQLEKDLPPPATSSEGNGEAGELDVIIVGAGAAGVGTAMMLTRTFGLDASRVLVVERVDEVGATFRRWPAEMRFISPSFNQQGWTSSFDLNSVSHGTSLAYSLGTEHPSGDDYAEYLKALVEGTKLNVRTQTEVTSVKAEGKEGGPPRFSVGVRSTLSSDGQPAATETLTARYVVWAAGEFQYPRECPTAVAGSELCLHNSRVRSWASLPGDDFVLIGGYESGSDAAVNLAKAGKRCTVLASTASWNVQTADPSTELAPYTAARLRDVTAEGFSPKPRLLAPLRVVRVEKAAGGGFDVVATWKAAESLPPKGPMRKPVVANAGADDPAGAEGSELVVHTQQPPVLCTGFVGSVAAAASHLFNLADESDKAKGCLAGAPMLSEVDESTKVPGVFLVGPQVRHGELSFCFIYKFRQRFAIVADAICRGLGRNTKAAVEECRKMNMFLDDFSCCEATCGEAC